jgi:quercetin dioxygenase-like cupin family protein
VNDEPGERVHPGDICMMNPGDYHTIENLSDTEELSMMALIYKKD